MSFPIRRSLLSVAAVAGVVLLGALGPPQGTRADARGIFAAHSHKVTKAKALKTKWAMWPKPLKDKGGHAERAKWADSNHNFFAGGGYGYRTHQKSYTSLGMIAGFAQDGYFQYSYSDEVGLGLWLGSYYSSSGKAKAVIKNARKAAGGSPSHCPSRYPRNCFEIASAYQNASSNTEFFKYRTWSMGNVVAEVGVTAEGLNPQFGLRQLTGLNTVAAAGRAAVRSALSH